MKTLGMFTFAFMAFGLQTLAAVKGGARVVLGANID